LIDGQGVTVVVPTLNRGAYVVDCICDLLAQDYRPLEILVVDQSENIPARVAQLVEAHPGLITYHHVRFRGSARARNFGWQRAQYETIVYLDDDIRCGPWFVKELVRVLDTPGVGVAAGGLQPVPGHIAGYSLARRRMDAGKFRTWTGTPLAGFEAEGEWNADHALEGDFAVRRRVMEAVGGFDEAFEVPAALYEGTDLCLRIKRAGFSVRFNGRARILHLGAPVGGNRVTNWPMYVYGLAHNRAILIRRHVPVYFWPTAVARLALLVLSYAAHYRASKAIATGLQGFAQGWRAAALPVKCTRFDAVGSGAGCGGPAGPHARF